MVQPITILRRDTEMDPEHTASAIKELEADPAAARQRYCRKLLGHTAS